MSVEIEHKALLLFADDEYDKEMGWPSLKVEDIQVGMKLYDVSFEQLVELTVSNVEWRAHMDTRLYREKVANIHFTNGDVWKHVQEIGGRCSLQQPTERLGRRMHEQHVADVITFKQQYMWGDHRH